MIRMQIFQTISQNLLIIIIIIIIIIEKFVLARKYRKIPKISSSMYKPLQM